MAKINDCLYQQRVLYHMIPPFFKKQSATISTGSGVMRNDEELTRESGDERVLVPTLPQQSCQHVIEQRI